MSTTHAISPKRFVARVEAATPRDRDRYLDFLRVVAILMVILGHWVVRVIVEDNGTLEATYLLEVAPQWQWATLIWQVMPVFFLAGGLVNAQSWRRTRAEGERADDWVRRRARRLLFPTLPVLVVLFVAGGLTHATLGQEGLLLGLDVAVVPFWFLAAYLLVTALTPMTLALHERGRGGLMVGLLLVATVVVDVVRFTVGGPTVANQPAIAGVNFALVWIVIHQIGYYWADGRLPTRAGPQAGILFGALALLGLMIGSGLYPLTMVPVEGTGLPNNGGPPSAALIVLGMAQLGLALLLRQPIGNWLKRPAAWAPVGLLGPKLISLFLWHQAVMVAVANIAYPLGAMPVTAGVDATWWWLRPLWVLYCAIPLAIVVLAMRRFDEPPAKVEARPGRPCQTGLGVLLFGAGVAALIGIDMHNQALPLELPWLSLAAVVAGMAALGAVRLADLPGWNRPD